MEFELRKTTEGRLVLGTPEDFKNLAKEPRPEITGGTILTVEADSWKKACEQLRRSPAFS